MEPFFAHEANLTVIRKAAAVAAAYRNNAATSPNVWQPLQIMLESIASNASVYDLNCEWNIKGIGPSLLGSLMELSERPTEFEATGWKVFVLSYRMLLELEMGLPDPINFELSGVKDFVFKHLNELPERYRSEITYAHYVMPAQIARRLLHHEGVADARGFMKALEQAGSQKKAWDEDIRARQVELDRIGAQLSGLRTEFNFVGLVDGFRHLAKTKRAEKLISFVGLLCLAVVVLVPVSAEIALVALRMVEVEKHKEILLYSLPALVTIELVLIYFFRVVLAHFRSIKAQLLQLDLRMALCQFIQSYTEYSAKIKTVDKSALEKFESLVFSGLLASEEALPSTFDGAEQVAKLVKALRGH